ncbi:MAG: hypothetical protein F6K19_01360 [Cyanothece sp. SIO1E1]|nr:hypothetical protein [Cyanothece sp. SIO1E1]
MAKKLKKIGIIPKTVALLLLGQLQSLILPRIQDIKVKDLLNLFTEGFKDVVRIFGDNDLENKAQLRNVLVKHGKTIVDSIFKILEGFLLTITAQADVKEKITWFVTKFKTFIYLFVDDNPDNKAQIEAYWKDEKFIIADEGIDSIALWIDQKAKDGPTKELIVSLLTELELKDIMEEEPAS